MEIREAHDADFDGIWPIFEKVARAGDTYAYPRDISRLLAYQQWLTIPQKTYVVELDDQIVATYYLKTNQLGPGSHVCNAGYMTDEHYRGRGIASAMCEHSLQQALAMGYKAMQYNFVASTNGNAVRLWQKHGFDIVGRLPGAFDHPVEGYVDALVMYKWLQNE
jgi:GNAT superfamily N-acetyltransferase